MGSNPRSFFSGLDKIVLFDFFENQKIRCPLFGERFDNFDI